MKIYAQILCVVLLALVYSCDAFFLSGQGGSISASASVNPSASRKPRIDPRAILGKLVGVKINLIGIVRNGMNKHFDRKIDRLGKFGKSSGGGLGSGSSSSGISSLIGGLIGGLGGLGGAAPKAATQADLDDFDSFGDDGDDGVSSYSTGDSK